MMPFGDAEHMVLDDASLVNSARYAAQGDAVSCQGKARRARAASHGVSVCRGSRHRRSRRPGDRVFVCIET